MPTFVNTPRGTVVSIWGKAYIRGSDGVWRPLKLGELVKPGDALLTEQNAIVQMSDGKGEPVVLAATALNPETERAIAALEQGQPEAAPAAGLAGGDGGDLQPGLRVERVVESVTASTGVERLDATALAAGVATRSDPADAGDTARVNAPSSSIGALESGAPVGLGLTAPTGGGSLVITVTQVPTIGQIVRADGTPVAAGATLSPSDLAGLRYVPPTDYDGVAPVGDFGFSVSNGTSSASGSTQIALTAVNDAPLAAPGSASGAEDALLGVSLGGTDIDGTIASVSVTSLPANGTLLLADGVTAVTANQALTPTQAAGLLFRPNADFNGSASLSFSVTDNGGLASSPAAFAITVTPLNDAPVAADDTVSTVGTVPVTLAVLANDSDVDGDPVAVSGASVDAALGSVMVNADGSLSFTAAAGVSGPVVVTYTVADPSGATDSATLTVNVAAAPAVTVDAPALTNDSTPALTGTTNLPPGATVALIVTGADGAVQSFTATVQPDGSYAASVPGALVDGPYSVSATVSASGAGATANDGGSVDTAVPSITVDAPALGNDSTPTISGTTDLPAGSTITLTVTGANGAVQTFTATVQSGGTYGADVPAALVDGGYSVVALGTDAAGNTGSASDSGVVDTTPPALTVDAPALGNDSTPTISGTTDLPAGSTVTLTVTDANGAAQTFSATVQAGGVYVADVPGALAEGPYTVVATASDAAGNAANASDSGVLDVTPPAIAVDAPALTNDSTPTITGTTNLVPGSTVTLVVTGADGATQSFGATVQAGGTYSADVPTALVAGTFGVVASATDPAGNSASATDSGVLDLTAPTLTVDAPALTNDSTPTITGATDLPAGAIVTLTVTGANGAVQTFTATVQAGGAYSADVPLALVEGSYNVVASASDAAGNGASANDSGAIDLTPPAITVDAPALTNDTTPTITGTTDLPVGAAVSLTVTGADGAVQTFGATVQAGGTYSADVPTALVPGGYAVVASGTDAAGNSASADDSGAIDLSAPALSVDAPTLGNDSKPTIIGTTDLPAGSTVTLTVTDANGAVQTFGATVQAGGSYGADVPAALAEGSYVVVATASDGAGNSATANDSGAIDLTPPAASITVDAVTADNIVNAAEAGTTVTLTGTVGGDVQPGDTVTLAVNGAVYSGLVQAGNTFAIAVAGSDVLADADRRIDASVTTTDAAGNSSTATGTRDYAVNTAPVAVADALAMGEDTAAAAGDVTPGSVGQDSDADGDALTVTGVATGALPSASGNVAAPLAGAWGTLTLNADGSYSYVPAAAAQTLDAGQTVTDTFTYTISDGRGGSASATLTLSVVGADDPTTIAGTLIGSVQEDAVASASGTLSASDPDVGTRAFITQSGTAGSHGTFSIDAAGNWSYSLANAAANVQALAAGQSVTETFVVAADDGTIASITVTVTGSNDAPVVSSTAINAVEEGAAVVLGLAVPSDIDTGAVLTITVTGLPTIGQVQLADGTPLANGAALTAAQLAGLRYLPPADYDGVSAVGSFGYSVSDGLATVSGGTSITLASVNDAPVTQNANAGTGENTLLSGSVPAASDVDGTVASYSLVTGPGAGNGSLIFNVDGSYTFDPGTDFDALGAGQARQVTFTYTATDNLGAPSAPATVTIKVSGTDDAPVVSSATGSVTEDTAPSANGTLSATDVDNPGLAFVAGTQAGTYGSLALDASGAWTYALGAAAQALDAGEVVTDSFSVDLTDGSTTTVTITVAGTNDGPVAVNDGSALSPVLTVAEDSGPSAPIVVLANDSDADGEALTVTAASSPHGSVAINPDQTLSFTPAPNFNGPATISYTVSDGQGATSSATVFVNVTPVNDVPVAGDDSLATIEDTPLTVSASALTANDSDADGHALTVVAVFSAVNGTATLVGSNVVFTPAPNYSGPASFAYLVTDGFGGTTAATAHVTVNPVNDAPLAAPASAGTGENAVLDASVPAASDVDGTIASYALVAGPAARSGSLVFNADGSYRFDPGSDFDDLAAGATRTVSFTYRAVDDQGANSPPATVTITVTGTNDGPVAVNDGSALSPVLTVAEDSGASAPITVLDNDSDIDGDALSVTAASSPNGSVTINPDNTLVFTPAANFNGLATISYSISDGNGGSSTATVFVNVTPVNDAPLAAGANVSTDEDLALSANLPAATDMEGNPVTYSLAAAAAHGTVVVNADGSYTYTPAANYVGADAFTYSVSDGLGGSNTYTVNVTVNPVNDAPAITSDGGGSTAAVSVAENTSSVTTVTATDLDPAQTLAYSIVGGADAARFSIDPSTGALAFVSAPDFEAPVDANGDNVYVVQVQVADGNGGTDLQTINVTVTDANEAPSSSADNSVRTEGSNGSGFLNVLSNDADAEGGPLTVAQVASSSSDTAFAANGITSITTALGGSVIMSADGSFRYIAPVVAHDVGNTPVADSFAYRASDGVDLGAWTTVTLNLADTAPTPVADSASVAFNSSTSGNLLANDSAVDGPARVSQFTHGATTVNVPVGGGATIDTAGGLLTVNSDGSYTYTSQLPSVRVLTGSSLATWEESTNLYGFTSGTPFAAGNLNLSSLTAARQSQVVFVNGAKNGIGVGTTGSGTLGSGETLVMNMLETTTQVTVGIAQLNSNQNAANATWSAFAADGTLVASGSFASATSTSNGNEYSLNISNATPFQYITLQWADGNQGFVLSSLDLTRNPTNYVETFSYVTTDADGDSASASFTVTPAASSDGGTTTTTGTAGHDTLSGSEAANTLNGLAGDDALRGFGGADTLDGGDGHDYLDGGGANDVLSGGNGADSLRGGQGNDGLSGGSGADTFEWRLADAGGAGSPAIDSVADFDAATPAAGGDILDLRDLLQGETSSATLDRYLDFSVSGGNTTIRISSTGAFTGGTYAAGSEDQRIVLSGVDIRASLGLGGSATDSQIISELINRGKLLTDVPAGS